MSTPHHAQPGETPEQAAFRTESIRFNTFLANTDQKVRTREAIHDGLEVHASEVLDRLSDPDYPFTALYAGAGNGGLEIPLTGELVERRGTSDGFEVFCEDPSAEMAEQFAAKLAAKDRPRPDALFTPDVLKKYDVIPFEDP